MRKGGGKKTENFADIISGSPLSLDFISGEIRAVPADVRQEVLHGDDGLPLPHLLSLHPLPRPHAHHLRREGSHWVGFTLLLNAF